MDLSPPSRAGSPPFESSTLTDWRNIRSDLDHSSPPWNCDRQGLFLISLSFLGVQLQYATERTGRRHAGTVWKHRVLGPIALE